MLKRLSVAALFAMGCSNQTATEPAKAAPSAEAPPPPPAEAATPVAAAMSCKTDATCGQGQLCIRDQCVAITTDLAECKMFRVHFPLDSAELDAQDRAGIDRIARCLRADQSMHVMIEGNADERGTEEYNLSLGDRRASKVEKSLELAGVSSSQLKTVTYGKINPLCTEHNEECWSKNRRAAVKPVEKPADKATKKKK